MLEPRPTQIFFNTGYSGSGGGSGGRIGIYLSQQFDFRGSITAFGGAGAYPGGPGTIYIELRDGPSVRRTLWIDGNVRNEIDALKVFLDEPDGYYHVFDEIKLTRKALVSLQKVGLVNV